MLRSLAIILACSLRAADGPYPPSQYRIEWDAPAIRIGDGKDGTTGDNWPITWGAGDALYTSYGDGYGFTPRKPLTLGFARVFGHPPDLRMEDIASDADTPVGWGDKGIKSSGMLMVEGVLYLFVRNYAVDGNYRHSRLAWSKDGGRHFTWADWHFAGTFGCPEFVQFGRNYRGARDGYVYVVSQSNDDAYAYAPDIVLARVAKARVADRRAYEFYAGHSWSADIAERRPVFTNARGVQRIAVTYNRGLRRYILTTSHKVGAGPHNASLGVFEAPEPWGPWRTIYYDDHWSGNNRTYHYKFPTKWMSADGRTMWLLYSGLGGGNYAFCLRKAILAAR